MKDFWLMANQEQKKIKRDFAKVKEQVKKTGDLAWDDEDYWRSLENKIMAKVESAEMIEGENRAWAPWERAKPRKRSMSIFPFFALVLCCLLAATGAVVATPVIKPNFNASISASSEKIEDTQYLLMHQDPNDFLIDVASRRADPIDYQVVR